MNRLKLFAGEDHPYKENIFKCYDKTDPVYLQLQSIPGLAEGVDKN